MKDLIEYDIYYKGKLLTNIIDIEEWKCNGCIEVLKINYINGDNKLIGFEDNIKEFEFKEVKIETSIYEVYSLAYTLTQQYFSRDGISNNDIITYLKKTHPSIKIL